MLVEFFATLCAMLVGFVVGYRARDRRHSEVDVAAVDKTLTEYQAVFTKVDGAKRDVE
jgi:hypothetical protein